VWTGPGRAQTAHTRSPPSGQQTLINGISVDPAEIRRRALATGATPKLTRSARVNVIRRSQQVQRPPKSFRQTWSSTMRGAGGSSSHHHVDVARAGAGIHLNRADHAQRRPACCSTGIFNVSCSQRQQQQHLHLRKTTQHQLDIGRGVWQHGSPSRARQHHGRHLLRDPHKESCPPEHCLARTAETYHGNTLSTG